jgi:hypothetical protein
METNRIRLFLIICIICAVLTIIALAIALLSPSIGYETSIYTGTPLEVWIFIAVNITICVTLLTIEAYQNKNDKWWFIPLGILMVNCILVLLMSVFRGYYTVGSDTLMHIGYVKDLANGIISPLNVYPLIHLIPALLVKLSMSAELATNLSPLYWYLIYVGSFYWLARIICHNKREIIIMTMLSALLLLPHGAGLAGTMVAVSIFPLTLVMIIRLCRKVSIKNVIIFILFIVFISFLHPLALEVAFIALLLAIVILMKHRKKIFIIGGCLLIGLINLF